jgi:cold shock CspA family protein
MNEERARKLQVGDVVVGECVTWVSTGRGYGFIRVPGVKRDTFAPARNILASTYLERGNKVRFEVRMGYDGRLMAEHIELIGDLVDK